MKKKMLSLVLTGIMAFALIGCGGADAPADTAPETGDTAQTEAETAAEVPAEAPAAKGTAEAETTDAGALPYAQAYITAMDDMMAKGDADLFALIDVDGDDVPELACSSTEGSWEKESVFLYTADGTDAVLLASDIAPGMEGHFIGFFEGKNVFVTSGAAAGESYTFYKIENAKAVEITSLSYMEMGDEVICQKDGADITEEEYLEAINENYVGNGDLTKLAAVDTKDMVVESASVSDGYLATEQAGTIPYLTYDELVELLK